MISSSRWLVYLLLGHPGDKPQTATVLVYDSFSRVLPGKMKWAFSAGLHLTLENRAFSPSLLTRDI
jgi:hypothetical protein